LELSQNLAGSLKGFLPQLAAWGERLFGTLANTGLGILQFAVSIIISGIFLVFFERGEEFLHISLVTIRNVAAGVLGVAVIQTSLMGVGLILANIPLAAVWIIVVLIIYLFAFRDPVSAVLWSL
jgi:predicted PurR-regulated permease PerM